MNGQSRLLEGKKFFFLVGAPRSGTTWLQLLLTRSPNVVSSIETHLFSSYLSPLFVTWNKFQLHGARNFTGLHHLLTEAEFHNIIRTVAIEVFAKVAEQKSEAVAILDKTPDQALSGKEILAIFPDARFIHIVRDPRAAVSSLLAASETWAADWAPKNVIAATEHWKLYVNRARSIKARTANYYELTYRDLFNDGPETLRRLFHWMEIEVTLEECSHYFEQCRIEKLRSGELKDAPWNIAATDTRNYFRVGRIDQWRSELSQRQVMTIELLTDDLMAELGFQRSKISAHLSLLSPAIKAAIAVRQALRWRLDVLGKKLTKVQ